MKSILKTTASDNIYNVKSEIIYKCFLQSFYNNHIINLIKNKSINFNLI